MEKFFEKGNEICKLIQMNIANRNNDIFLFNLFFESEKIPEDHIPATSTSGIIFSTKELINKAKEVVDTDPQISFAIFYNFEFNTYKISAAESELKIQYTEWMSEVVGLYTYLCWPRINIDNSDGEIRSLFKGRKFVYLNEFASPLAYTSDGNLIKLTDKNAKENAIRIAEVKKYHIYRDTNITLKNVFMFNIEMWSISENDNQPSQIIDFVKVSKVYADQIMYVYLDDFATNYLSLIERILHACMQLPPGSESFLTVNHSNKILVKSKKKGFDTETLGTSVKSLMSLHPTKLRNIHFSILNSVPLKKFLADPNYIYFHYLQENVKDEGWGCAYRSLQTIFSWYVLNGHTTLEIPTFEIIQQTLVDIGDKSQTFLGSTEWIGSTEITYVLQRLLGIECQILTFTFGSEIVNNLPKLKQHFELVKTPIMIGGTVLAWTLLGIAMDEDSPQNSKFLILDPHYKGKDEIKQVVNPKSKAIYWADSKIFKNDARYNFCLPLIKKGFN